MKKHVGCRLLVLLGAPHHAIISTDHPLPLNAMRKFPWALLRLMRGLSFMCTPLHCMLSGQSLFPLFCDRAFIFCAVCEPLIGVNEDEAAEENANEWAAVLRVANKHM